MFLLMNLPVQNAKQRLFLCKTILQNCLLHFKKSIFVVSPNVEAIKFLVK